MIRYLFLFGLLMVSGCYSENSPYVQTETEVVRAPDKEVVGKDENYEDDDGMETLKAVKDMFEDPYHEDKY